MVIVVINTNIERSAFPEDFLKGFAETYADATDKPKRKNSNCCLHAGMDMVKFGNNKPAATISIQYGHKLLDEASKRSITKKLMDYVKAQLNLDDDIMRRFVVVFEKINKEDMGNGQGFLLSDKQKD